MASSLRLVQKTCKYDKKFLNIVSEFEKDGKIRTLVQIYTKIIDKEPHNIEAYRMLWSVWARNNSLKVSTNEMNTFIYKYRFNSAVKNSVPFNM